MDKCIITRFPAFCNCLIFLLVCGTLGEDTYKSYLFLVSTPKKLNNKKAQVFQKVCRPSERVSNSGGTLRKHFLHFLLTPMSK